MSPQPTFLTQTLVAAFLLTASSLFLQPAPAPASDLTISSGELTILGEPGRSHQLEASSDLKSWNLVHAVRDQASWSWPDPDTPFFAKRYYRLIEQTPASITNHTSWKSSITLPDDPFLSAPLGGATEVRYVKFALLLDGLPTVYFQDSNTYPFHFQFATERLDPLIGLTLPEFNTQSLYLDGQRIVLGAVLWAPDKNEYGIQLVGQDAYPREFVKLIYQSVDAAIIKPPNTNGFYLPTFEQSLSAQQELDYFTANGIQVSSSARWSSGTEAYSSGWALGRLKFFHADEIDAAYIAGNLLPTDILVTDGVPAEVPFVAGLITFVPTTPNSHVVILARAYGIPFLYIADNADHAAIQDQIASGQERLFRCVKDNYEITDWTLANVNAVNPVFLAELRALKEAPELTISPISALGNIVWPNLATANTTDIDHIGGKAANFGFLRRAIPENSPQAIAFSFDLWNAYLDQSLPTGATLRAEIASRLSGFSWPTNIAQLDAALAGVRDLIKDGSDFSTAQKTEIITALNTAGFDQDRKLRFRSSTNVEDSDQFVGAGLYDSFSGCLHDDTDNDEIGPSHCDPSEPNERGVFRAMRKVYASFYNRNAFIERLRHGINEPEVGMAVLVHYSFPDELEAANGVATGALAGSTRSTIFSPTLVSQIGANSVTNPDGASLPEVVYIDGFRASFGFFADPSIRQRSSLLQLGQESVMSTPDDYSSLCGLMMDVAVEVNRWNQRYELEFEYKKLTSGELVIKQVRHVPDAGNAGAEFPALVNTPTTWKLFQGEHGSIFGNHRMKSKWQIEFDSRWLNTTGLSNSFISNLQLDWLPHGILESKAGPPSSWPNPGFTLTDNFSRQFANESWQLPTSAGNTNFELQIMVPSLLYNQIGPIFFPQDFRQDQLWVHWIASYPTPQLDFAYDGIESTSTTAVAALTVGNIDDPPREGSTPVHRTINEPNVDLDIQFYWPPQRFEAVGGYTAPLEAWEQTTITGLTSEPIVLRGYYSQTYRPEHHNFSEHFLFEPALEPGISPTILSSLNAQNIRYIYAYASGGPTEKILAIGFDGNVWRLQ